MSASATSHLSVPPSASSRRSFRESVHLIPTPGIERPRPKRYEPPILSSAFSIPLSVLTVGLGIALEVALYFSYKHNGFHVPSKNVFSFVSTQFLTSFFPTLLIIPIAFLWSVTDWFIRWYQPYVTLAQGNVTAEDSLLLDYIALNKLFALFVSRKHKHWVITASAATALVSILLQPLAGSIFQIRDLPFNQDTTVQSLQTVGLSPGADNLDAFIASAGFATAAVFNSLPDPPFISGNWSAAGFQVQASVLANQLNGTITAKTTGILNLVNCANPSSSSLEEAPGGNGNYILTTTFGTCISSVTFNPSDAEGQYGVHAVPNCGPEASANVTFQPVMFWFFHADPGGANNQTAGVFCAPTIGIYDIEASLYLNTMALVNVTVLNDYAEANNVSGSPLDGQAFNGVIFENSSDPFIQARASATQSEVPGAIFRFASQQPNGPGSVFNEGNGFLDITNTVYTQHLAVAAKSIYFVAQNEAESAVLTSLGPKLWVEPLSAHLLAFVLIIIGTVGLGIHIVHKRARRNLYLTAPPGSIAAIVSLTSRSGFGDLLLPYDDVPAIAKKLEGLRFKLDERTGAILAEGEDSSDDNDIGMHREDAKMALLGRGSKSVSHVSPLPGITEMEFEPFKAPYEPFKTPYEP